MIVFKTAEEFFLFFMAIALIGLALHNSAQFSQIVIDGGQIISAIVNEVGNPYGSK